jgi:hypothetical protein
MQSWSFASGEKSISRLYCLVMSLLVTSTVPNNITIDKGSICSEITYRENQHGRSENVQKVTLKQAAAMDG